MMKQSGRSVAMPGASRQRGVSLIEVLVAMLVVSMGVLAVAGLMATSSRYGKTSEYRAVATLLASDIVDRIRANKPAINPTLAPPGDVTAYNMTGSYDSWASEPDDFPGCATPNICLAAEIALQDRAEWGRAVFNALPGGAAYVQLSADPIAVPTADVWIAWLDPDASSNEATADVDGRSECPPGFQGLSPQPRCAYFRVGL